MNHRAPAVRISSLRGIRDILSSFLVSTTDDDASHNNNVNISGDDNENIPKNNDGSINDTTNDESKMTQCLPILMPTLSQCLADADPNVRSLAIHVWRLLISVLRSHSHSGNNAVTSISGTAVLKPFLPLAAAHVSSALDGLCPSLRKDGATAAGTLCESMFVSSSSKSSNSSSNERLNDNIANNDNNDDTSGINNVLSIIAKGMLPSFSRIFKECIDHQNHLNDGITDAVSSAVGTRGSGGLRNHGNGKKKKRSSKSSSTVSSIENKDNIEMLRSLVHILKATSSSSSSSSSSRSDHDSNDHDRMNQCHYYLNDEQTECNNNNLRYINGAPTINAMIILRSFSKSSKKMYGDNDNGNNPKAILHSYLMDTKSGNGENKDDKGTITSSPCSNSERNSHRNNNNKNHNMTSHPNNPLMEAYIVILSTLKQRIHDIVAFVKGITEDYHHQQHQRQRGSKDRDPTSTLRVANPSIIHELSLITNAIRLIIHNVKIALNIAGGCGDTTNNNINNHMSDNNNNQERNYVQELKHLGNALLECFPVVEETKINGRTTNSGVNNKTGMDGLNAILCLALHDIGNVTSSNSSDKDDTDGNDNGTDDNRRWINAILEYVLPKFAPKSSSDHDDDNHTSEDNPDNDSNKDNNNMNENDDNHTDNPTSLPVTVALVGVVGNLLLRNSNIKPKDEYNNQDKEFETEVIQPLLEALRQAFFSYPTSLPSSSSTTLVTPDTAFQNSRRAASMLLASLLVRHFRNRSMTTRVLEGTTSNTIATTTDNAIGRILIQMAAALPNHLLEWGDSYPMECSTILLSLISVIRCHDPDRDRSGSTSVTSNDIANDDDHDTGNNIIDIDTQELRASLLNSVPVFFVSSENTPSSSLFERCHSDVQRLIMSLVGSLGVLSESLFLSLAKILAYSGCNDGIDSINETVADYAMEIIHGLRHTLPMKDYLTFLITSVGVEHHLLPQSSSFWNDDDSNDGDENIGENIVEKLGGADESDGKADNNGNLNDDIVNDGNDISNRNNNNKSSTISVTRRKRPMTFSDFSSCIDPHDVKLARSCRYLARTGLSEKVLYTMLPVLSKWILQDEVSSSNGCKDSNDNKNDSCGYIRSDCDGNDKDDFLNGRIIPEGKSLRSNILKVRTSIAIISCCCIAGDGKEQSLEQDAMLLTTMESQIAKSIVKVLFSLPLARMVDIDEDCKNIFLRLLAPVQVS